MDKTTSETATAPTREQVRDAFQALYDGLGQAYWAATTIESKDRIYGIEEIVYEAVIELNKEDIESNDELYKQVKDQVKSVIDKIDKLKDDIDTIIHAINIAADVAAGIDKAVQLAAKYFGI